MANVAHELRTPLATLCTSIEVMQSDAQATLNEYRAIVATLERSLIRLEKSVHKAARYHPAARFKHDGWTRHSGAGTGSSTYAGDVYYQ